MKSILLRTTRVVYVVKFIRILLFASLRHRMEFPTIRARTCCLSGGKLNRPNTCSCTVCRQTTKPYNLDLTFGSLNLFQCSMTCGSGIKIRVVECSDKDFPCDARTKPQITAQCNPEPCPEWKARAWGQVRN